MKDPFPELRETLQPVFQVEVLRNDKYAYPPVQALKEAIVQYDQTDLKTFHNLLKAICESRPFIEKRLPFERIKTAMDHLAKYRQLPKIPWHKMLNEHNAQRFPFSAANFNEEPLMPWLSTQINGRSFMRLNRSSKTEVLITHCEQMGFSQKLKMHLEEKPHFLFHLLTCSKESFIKILQSRVILHLTDLEIAKAIIKFIPQLVADEKNPSCTQVKMLIDSLDEALTNGRSVTTLLRSGDAKAILDQSIYFQVYQSPEFKNELDAELASRQSSVGP